MLQRMRTLYGRERPPDNALRQSDRSSEGTAFPPHPPSELRYPNSLLPVSTATLRVGTAPLSVPIDLSEWESRKRTAYGTVLGWESPRALTALESRLRPFRDHMAGVEEIRSNG